MNWKAIYERICDQGKKVEKTMMSASQSVELIEHRVVPFGVWGSTTSPENITHLTHRQHFIAWTILARRIYPGNITIANQYKAVLSAARKHKFYRTPKYLKPGHKRYHPGHSIETRMKMSAAHTGKTFSVESRMRMSEAKRGKSLSAEHVKARSESRKRNARGFSDETRERMRLAALNRKKSSSGTMGRRAGSVNTGSTGSTSNWSVGR